MKTVLTGLIIFGILGLLAACPQSGDGDNPTADTTTSAAATADTPPAEDSAQAVEDGASDPTTADAADEAADGATPPSADSGSLLGGEVVGLIDSRLEVDGIKVGIAADDLLLRYPPDGDYLTSMFWVEPGKTGMIGANDKVIPDIAEASYFLNSQLVGFMRHDMIAATAYDQEVAELTGQLGEPSVDPPAWAMETSVFADYAPPAPEDEIRYAFWSDEENRTVLLASYEVPTAHYMLWMFHADWFDKAVELTSGAMAAQAGGALPPGVD